MSQAENPHSPGSGCRFARPAGAARAGDAAATASAKPVTASPTGTSRAGLSTLASMVPKSGTDQRRGHFLWLSFPDVQVLGHPGLTVTLPLLPRAARTAAHREAALSGPARAVHRGVVGSDEAGRAGVAGPEPALADACGAEAFRAGADHPVGADDRALPLGHADPRLP